MEEEKVIQIAVAECDENTTYLCLTNTGRIFKGGDVSKEAYRYKFGWKELPCPLNKETDAKALEESQTV
jgi:hypothetical protein